MKESVCLSKCYYYLPVPPTIYNLSTKSMANLFSACLVCNITSYSNCMVYVTSDSDFQWYVQDDLIFTVLCDQVFITWWPSICVVDYIICYVAVSVHQCLGNIFFIPSRKRKESRRLRCGVCAFKCMCVWCMRVCYAACKHSM